MTWVVVALVVLPAILVGMLVALSVLDERRLQQELRERPFDRELKKARHHTMTDSERELQRRSFAYGNAKLSNPHVTRQMVDDAANKFGHNDDDTPPPA